MKTDYLKECLSDLTQKVKKSIPIDQFNAEFCVYCLNNGCSRSGTSNMLFERRAKHWESDLFLNVPRANDRDPTYDHIRLKWFSPPNAEVASHTPVVQNTISEPIIEIPSMKIDPDVMDSVDDKVETEPHSQIVEAAQEEPEKIPEKVPEQVLVPEPHSVVTEPRVVPPVSGGNTSWSDAGYLENPSKPSSNDTNEVVISPGGTFTFG